MKNEKFWHQKRHNIYMPVLIVISIWLRCIGFDLTINLLFTTGDNRIGLNFLQNIRWTFVEWSPIGYFAAVIILWIKSLNPWFIRIGMLCYVLLFANYINGEWDAYYFSFGSVVIIAAYVIWQSFYTKNY